MRVLLDTNVILDVLCAREPFLADASKVWKLCEVEKLDGTEFERIVGPRPQGAMEEAQIRKDELAQPEQQSQPAAQTEEA